MQNMSYFLMPGSFQYFAFVPLSPSSPETMIPHQEASHATPAFSFYPSNMDAFYRPAEYLPFVQESANNQMENHHPCELQSLPATCDKLPSDCRPTLTLPPIVVPYNPTPSEDSQSNSISSRNIKYKQQGKQRRGSEAQDLDYVPQVERKRRGQVKYQQNQNRNIIPNEINQIFSFIQKKNKSGHIVEKLFKKFPHGPGFSPKRFYLYQSLLKGRLGHYTNEKSLKLVTELYEPKCESWPESEQRYYNKICRVLIRHFLHEDSIFIILTSKRMKSDKKYEHLRARRQLSESVIRILKGF